LARQLIQGSDADGWKAGAEECTDDRSALPPVGDNVASVSAEQNQVTRHRRSLHADDTFSDLEKSPGCVAVCCEKGKKANHAS
jgi:hypothetical protein